MVWAVWEGQSWDVHVPPGGFWGCGPPLPLFSPVPPQPRAKARRCTLSPPLPPPSPTKANETTMRAVTNEMYLQRISRRTQVT